MISFTAAPDLPGSAEVLGVPVFAGRHIPPGAGAEVDAGFLKARGFEGKAGETLALLADDGTTIIAVGVGDRATVDADVLRRAAASFVRAAWRSRRAATTLLAAAPSTDRARAAQAVVEGAGLAAYGFSAYKSSSSPCAVTRLVLVDGDGDEETRRGIERGTSMVGATSLARDLVNEPAGAMTPTVFAARAADIASASGLRLRVWDEIEIGNEGLGGLMGVARGSAEPPRLVELAYEPEGATTTIAFVGKGITFDSGGLSIKTADGMKTMKTDMSGAAAVLGAMSVLRALGAPVRVLGLAPLTENMPGGRAIKPGDVLKIRNGKTVEVLNTDAEGRLVLADALSLAVEAGADAIVDVATLTGACVQALGREIGGLFGTDEDLLRRVEAAAARAGEPLWRLPLFDRYRRHIDSEIADMKNQGAPGQAGATAAALFLREYVGATPWCHLDIAGPARAEADDGFLTRGGTGFATRTLVELAVGWEGPEGVQ